MRHSRCLLIFAATAISMSSAGAQNQDKPKLSAKIISAKTIYFDDQIRDAAVSSEALKQMKKWGRFRIVKEAKDADLILELSADPRKGGYVVFSGGQTGTLDRNGEIQEDPVPSFNKQSPIRYAYLTVFDAKTGENLWSAEHQWGGVVTGVHSAGARLVNRLRKDIEK